MATQLFNRVSSRIVLFLAVLLFAVSSSPLAAASLPTGFTEALIASGLASPTAMQFAPDGRLFVCEQGGRLRVIKDGVLLPAPFLTVSVSSVGERGLLGVAFDPAFATNRYVYVYYTATAPAIHNRISRFTANGDTAVAGSEVILLELDNLSSATNHNGGALGFGLDGKLYAAVGENANSANAQTLTNLLGKILRINNDGTIPADNPFVGTAAGKNQAIWALGLRNPFTFAFHPDSGRLFINDVGENTWEEINEGISGANYGWPTTEGPTSDARYVSPRYAYNHNQVSGSCAITGGTFYSPPTGQFPLEYIGGYFFADYCAGWIRKVDPSAGYTLANFATGIASPVDLKVAGDGSLYYLARGTGSTTGAVYQIRYGQTAPSITTHPASRSAAPGASVTFSVRASGTPPLRYQWQRNGINIGGATLEDYVISAVTISDDSARFRAVVSNDYGSVTSNEAVLTVTPNQAPTGTITQPVTGTLYSGGTVINYAGTATDPEDGTLPPSAFTWQVDFHHDTHTHPVIAPTTGSRTGSFTIPTTGETSANVWYRIHLTVRDAGGLTHSTYRDVLPRKVRLTLATSPAALQLSLDGQPVSTPLAFDAVVGITRSLGAPTPQTSGSTSYDFVSWSDGGAVQHNISTPATDTTYTAAYRAGTGVATGVISIDFVGSAAAMGATESAGVVLRANWNSAVGATRTAPLALKNESGATTAATATWTSNNTWMTPTTDQTGSRRMMKGYLDTSTTSSTTVTVAGLSSGAYDVYVYADGDNASGARTGGYAISGAGITPATIMLTDGSNTNFNTTFTEANGSVGNYVKFSITAGGFTLTATPGASSDSNRRAPINGIQIVPVGPPPSDFTVTATPASQTVTPGSGTSYTVTVGAQNGFAGTVTLAVTGLPANATGSFNPATVAGSGTAMLTVTTAGNTPTGNTTLSIAGTSGPLSHTTTVALNVGSTTTAGVVSIDFVGSATAMGAAETAGVVARGNWNSGAGATRTTPLALKNDAGAATGATATWTSNNTWMTPTTDQAGSRRMMKGYLDTTTTSSTTVMVAGLSSERYDIYVYVDGDNTEWTRSASYAISGAGITPRTIVLTDAANTNFNATFIPADGSVGNYVKFSVTGSGFTLTATPGTSTNSTRRAPINGIQIVPSGQ